MSSRIKIPPRAIPDGRSTNSSFTPCTQFKVSFAGCTCDDGYFPLELFHDEYLLACISICSI